MPDYPRVRVNVQPRQLTKIVTLRADEDPPDPPEENTKYVRVVFHQHKPPEVTTIRIVRPEPKPPGPPTMIRIVRPDPKPPGPDRPLTDDEMARARETIRTNRDKIAKWLGRDREGLPVVDLDD